MTPQDELYHFEEFTRCIVKPTAVLTSILGFIHIHEYMGYVAIAGYIGYWILGKRIKHKANPDKQITAQQAIKRLKEQQKR